MTRSNKAHAQPDDTFSLIKNEKLLSLYSRLMACRNAVGAIAGNGSRGGRRGRLKWLAGSEAAVVGAVIDMEGRDTVASSLWPEAMFRTVNRTVSFTEKPEPAAPVLADEGCRAVTVYFAQSAARDRVFWRKTLARAVVAKLPILFVTVTTIHEADLDEAKTLKAIGVGGGNTHLPWINVDGSDVVAVYRVASEAIIHARKGNGPTVVDCVIQPAEDPIENMTRYLRQRGFLIEA